MVSSYCDCLLFVVWYAMVTVPNRKMYVLPPNGELVFCGFICGEGNDALVSVGLVWSTCLKFGLLSVFGVDVSLAILSICSL